MLTQKDFDQIEGLIDEKLDEKIKFLPSKDEFYSKMDDIMGELKAIREEQEIITGKTSEYNDTIENHDASIEKFEKTIISPSR